MNPRNLPHETLFAIDRLWRGGISDANEIGLIVGVPGLDEPELEEVIEYVESLAKGPLPVAERVRCSYCGVVLTDIPCCTCKPPRPSYRPIEDHAEPTTR